MANHEQGVLSRRGARVVTMEKANSVRAAGGPQTDTVCTFDPR